MNSRLRIAVATHFFPTSSQPNRGRPIYQMIRALSSLADVQVFCVDPLYPRYKFLQQRAFLNPDYDASYTTPGVQAEYLRYRALPLVSRVLNGYNCGRILTPHVRTFRPDVIIGYFLYPPGFGSLAAGRHLKIPVIVGALGSDLRGVGTFGRIVASETMRRASFVLTVSDELRKCAIELGIPPEKTRTIRNGCDSNIFKPADRPAARAELNIDSGVELVVFTGRLVPTKGLRELLQAAMILLPLRPHLRVVCVGEGVMEKELRQLASQPQLKGHVEFVGDQDANEVARWLAASNVFCLPSYSEGCPNVVIEALSCGRPVVASDVGGIPELMASRCGILVPPRDARQLADALSKALNRPWNQEEIAGSFRRSWNDVARETHDVCCSVVRDGGM